MAKAAGKTSGKKQYVYFYGFGKKHTEGDSSYKAILGGKGANLAEMALAGLPVPAGFTIQTPPRIAIDLPGITNAMGKSSVELNQGNLRSANIVEAGDRTRLVLNLNQASQYQTQLAGNVLLVTLDGAAPRAVAVGKSFELNGEKSFDIGGGQVVVYEWSYLGPA